MKCNYACGTAEHLHARRRFLGNMAAGSSLVVGGLGALTNPSTARQLETTQKRMIVINMAGGLSQLESWDPKPGTNTGGPFRAIETSVPGVHISELLPYTAQQMHNMAIVRSINTHNGDHGKGTYMMLTGRRQTPAADFPRLGAVVAKGLDQHNSALPGHIQVGGGSGARNNDSAYLGPRYASISLGSGTPPQNSARPKSVSEQSDATRNRLRRKVNSRFAQRRRTAKTDAYTQNYEQAIELMAQRDVFDISKESQKDRDRYGPHPFGHHLLLARRLVENGITFVQVSHSNYDTHNENFNFHLEQLGEFDRPFATLIEDLAASGMLEHTLVVVLSEFGRTPNINKYYGRDHWGNAWSICMSGAGLQRGAVIGKTNDNGTKVTDREGDAGHMFHTYLQALGLDSAGHFDIGGRPIPLADPAFGPITELMS